MADSEQASPVDDSLAAVMAAKHPLDIDEGIVRGRLLASMFGMPAQHQQVGRYVVLGKLGQGGMGTVLEAFDRTLDRRVAIKLLHEHVDEQHAKRLLREAQALAKLSHPNVVQVYEVGQSGGQTFIAMELVQGHSLQEWLSRAPRPSWREHVQVYLQAGEGLAAAHARGLVHRDFKPGNAVLDDDGRVRVLDFGLARRAEDDAEDGRGPTPPWLPPTVDDDALRQPLTRTGALMGTPAYMAPEQLRGLEADAKSDQFGYCVALYEAVYGERPFTGKTMATLMVSVVEGQVPPAPKGSEVPAALRAVLVRGLAVDPRARWPSMQALLAELRRLASPRRRGWWTLGAAGGLGAALAAIAVVQLREPATTVPPCSFDASVLADTWDDTRREALRERVASSELPFAETTLASLERGLDAWAAGWVDARKDACAATRIEGMQSEAALDLRNVCLERKRRAVEVTLDTLLEDGEGRARRLAAQAPELLDVLPRIEDCADPERLAEIEPLPEPGPRRDAVLRGYDVLAQARALAAAGAIDEARARVSALEQGSPAALAYVPLQLELRAFPAQLDVIRERTGRAIPTLVELAREAAVRRLDELAATLLVEAAHAAAGRWSKPELEQWLVDEAAAALRRLARPDDARTVSLRVAKGQLLAQAGRLDDALATHREAHALARRLGDEAGAEASTLNVAARLADLRRFDEARATLEAGRDAARQRWGARAPLVALYESDLALLAIDTGQFESAATHLDRAEAIVDAAFGAASLKGARARFARTKLDMVVGDFQAGLARTDEVLAILTRELGPDHELLANVHEARGVFRFFTGDLPGSIESYEAALHIRASMFGPEHPLLARLHSNIGESQLGLHRLGAAQASFDRALASLARALPSDHPDLAFPLKGRGQVALAEGRGAHAVVDLERALEIQLAGIAEPLEIADLRFSLARALEASEGHRSARAKELASTAPADFAERDMHEQVVTIDGWLRQ
jgi:tetratricopeptide (TPR) repeat protein